MKQFPIKVIPVEGIDLDTDNLRMRNTRAAFIKNFTTTQHKNGNQDNGTAEGGNFSVYSPLEGAVIVSDIPAFPAGKNICVGTYYSKETYEAYVMVYNHSGDHFIYVYGQFTPPTIVYQNPDLNFQLNPEHYITEGRCHLETRIYTDSNGVKQLYKFLFFTENYNHQRCIEVNSSIATNSYDVSLPFFDNPNYDRTRLINLGVVTPSECIGIDPIPRGADEAFEQNQMSNRMWQWRIMYKTRFGEVSAYGIISEQYTPVVGSGCISGSDGLPRCVKLTIEAGNPFVEWIEVAFRINGGDWKKYDTLAKYDNVPGVPWYERSLSSDLVNYDSATNKFEYVFCGDKQWDILPQEETTRKENYLPKRSAALFPLDLSLGLANNVRGFEPIPKAELEKIDIVAVPPEASCSDNPTRKIVVYAFILNHWRNAAGDPLIFTQGIVSLPYQLGHAPTNAEFGHPDTWWGARLADYAPFNDIGGAGVANSSTYWGQFFRHNLQNNENDPRNFTGFMKGTPYSVTAEQYRRDGNNECNVGIWDYNNPPTSCNASVPAGVMLQRFEFDVPPGVYEFGIANHKAVIDDLLEYQKTSTTVYGTALMGNLNAANLVTPFAGYASLERSLVIDCTNGDVILNQPNDKCLVILDLAKLEPGVPVSNAVTYDGYLKEDEIGDIRLERMAITMPSPTPSVFTAHTDHNGYWFVSMLRDDPTQDITGPTAHELHAAVNDCNSTIDIALTGTNEVDADNVPYSAGSFWWQLKTSAYTGNDPFPDEGRTHLKGRIALCGNSTIGLRNMPVVIEGGLWSKTNNDGDYDVIVHNWGGAYAGAQIRSFVSNGGCFVSYCSSRCDFPDIITSSAPVACGTVDPGLPCYDADVPDQRLICLPELLLQVLGVDMYGPQNGALYQVCVNGYDWLGRTWWAATLDKFRVATKSISETQVYDFSTITFDIDPSISLPPEVDYITFGVTPNLNFSKFIHWPIDQAQFIDSTGKTNNANPEYVRFYYGGLREYNKNFNYKTNVNWQFISQEGALNTLVQNDQVEFIQKGDGTWFDKRIVCEVLYDSQGQFFTVKYTNELAELMDKTKAEGAIIKFMRPKDFQDNSPYFELCTKIKVTNGVPEVLSGTIPLIDAYMLQRRIPRPVPLEDLQGNYVTYGSSNSTENPLKENNVYKFFDTNTEQENDEIYYGVKFEHDSPSDFWGEKVTNRGRINTVNPYEAEKRFKSEVILSKALSEASNFNGLSYFDSNDVIFFNQENWGGIMAVLPDMNRVLFICEFDHFLAGYKESGMRQGQDGTIIATQNIGNFSVPIKRQGQEFGCQPYFISTIRKHKGMVYWLDGTRQALVQCDYNASRDMSRYDPEKGIIGGYKSYLNEKIEKHDFERSISDVSGYFPIFIGGINPRNEEYMLTYNQIPYGGTLLFNNPSYLNLSNILDYNVDNDTLIIDLKKGYLKSFAAFTPEYYTMVESLGGALMSLRQGKLWSHINEAGAVYNNFYGTQCKKVIEVVYNEGPEKVKRWLFNEVYAKEHLFIADRIISEVGQESRILSAHWRSGEHFFQAPFLCDINTTFQAAQQAAMAVKAVVAGDLMSGRWLKVRYISPDAHDSKYVEISAFVAYALGIEKSAD